MIRINAMGEACPLPVVKTLRALQSLGGAGSVETLVDNETAVQNLRRLAESKGCSIEVETISDAEYRVTITAAEGAELPKEEAIACTAPAAQKKTVVVISADHMGEGNEELGRALLKAFLFALTQQETLPAAILFYNAGAAVTCEGSASLEDLQALQSQGVDVDQGVVHAEGPEGRHDVLDGADTVAAGFDRRAARGVHHVVAKCRDLRLSFDIGAAEYDAPAGFCGMDRHRHLHARMQSLSRERDRGLQRLLFR